MIVGYYKNYLNTTDISSAKKKKNKESQYMVSHPENGSDSPIGSNRDRGRDTSIEMSPYEALYGKQCRTPLYLNETGERKLLGPEIVQTTVDKVNVIRARLKAAQDRQKSYADKRRKGLEFEVEDRVFLKLSPWKGVVRFGKRGKLSPHYIGPFEIVDRIGPVAYRLDLPEELSRVYNVFHISML